MDSRIGHVLRSSAILLQGIEILQHASGWHRFTHSYLLADGLRRLLPEPRHEQPKLPQLDTDRVLFLRQQLGQL